VTGVPPIMSVTAAEPGAVVAALLREQMTG
jgi:hypothetical protein